MPWSTSSASRRRRESPGELVLAAVRSLDYHLCTSSYALPVLLTFKCCRSAASVDWRTKNVVTKVKDQGGCGGCWSFSAAETLESHIAINTGKLFTFSEQEILACTPNPNQCGGTGGCNG